MYSSFLTMLNMVDFTGYEAYIHLIMALHIFFVFMISILLINFLIAMFSTSYSDVAENQEVIFIVQSLSVIWTLDLRTVGPVRKLVDYFQRKYFVYEDGRYYVSKVTIA